MMAKIFAYLTDRGAEPLHSRIKSEADAQNVAAIWMIACIDENPGIIYASAATRLKIETSTVIQIVADWRELFRPGINKTNQTRYKSLQASCLKLLAEQNPGETDFEQCKKNIEEGRLEEWCFRSQFRLNLNDPKSSIEQIEFGLTYIDTQRKSYIEFADKKRQDKNLKIPMWSIAATLILGLFGLYFNYEVGKRANELKEQELRIKQEELTLKKQQSTDPVTTTR